MTPEIVLKASSHVERFTDLMVTDTQTGNCRVFIFHFMLVQNHNFTARAETGPAQVECPAVTPEVVLKASDHIERFTDLMVTHTQTGNIVRYLKPILRSKTRAEAFSAQVECPAVTPEIVLKASGHVERFTDLMVTDTQTGDCHRADHLLEHALEALLEDTTNPLGTDKRKVGFGLTEF